MLLVVCRCERYIEALCVRCVNVYTAKLKRNEENKNQHKNNIYTKNAHKRTTRKLDDFFLLVFCVVIAQKIYTYIFFSFSYNFLITTTEFDSEKLNK